MATAKRIPRWLQIVFTGWILIWIPLYISFYGPQNFLWICDLCNFIILIALWTENRLLFSSQIVAVLIIDVLWSIDVASAILTGTHIIGGTEYMFNPAIPGYIRLMSLFHVFTPPLLIYAVLRLGYDRRGIMLQSGLTWIVLLLTFLYTEPVHDINWVFGLFGKQQTFLDPWLYLFLTMLGYPLIIYLPTHGFLMLGIKRFKPGLMKH